MSSPERLRRRAPLVLALALLLLATGCPKTPEPSKTAQEAEAGKHPGQEVFETKCATCHTIGTGDGIGPDLKGVTGRREKAWLTKWIKDPTEMLKTDPIAQELLKKFKNVPMTNQNLSDKEIEDVLAYIKAESAKTPSKKPMVLAKDIGGRSIKQFVSSECGGCHNPRRTGATGPDITKLRLHKGTDKLSPLSLGAIVATVKHGRVGTLMPAWSKDSNPIARPLTEGEINAICKYIYDNEAPESFSYTIDEMNKTHEVFETKLPDKPTHGVNMANIMLVTEREASRIAVIDCEKQEVVTRMKGGVRVHGYTFHPNGRYVYNLARDGWLYMYDLYTFKPMRRVRLGMDARGIAVSDNGKWLLCGMYIPSQAVIVDAHTLKPKKLILTDKVEDPDGKIVSSRICSVNDVSEKVGPYFLMALKEGGQVWRIDWSDETFPITKALKIGKILHDGFLRPDNKVFFLAAQDSDWMAVVDVKTLTLVKNEHAPEGFIKTGKKPHPGAGAVWHGKGKDGKQHLFAATPHIGEGKNVIWDAETFEIVGEVSSKGPGLFVRTCPEMKNVWFDSVFFGGEEIVVHSKDYPFKVVRRINEGTLTVHPEPDASGQHVYVSDWKEGVIRIYKEDTAEKVKTLTGFTTPTGKFSIRRLKEHEGH